MIYDRNTHEISHYAQTPRQSDVLVARRRVARGMIVGDNGSGCCLLNQRPEHFTGVYFDVHEAAPGNFNDIDDTIASVQRDRKEDLLHAAGKAWAQVFINVVERSHNTSPPGGTHA